MQIAVSTSCFIEKHEGYIITHEIPSEVVNGYKLEVQFDRGFTFDELPPGSVKSVHLPFARYIPALRAGNKVYLEGRTINIATIDDKKWQRDLDYYEEVLELSRGKGIRNAIVHYGNCTCGEEAYKNSHHRDLHWRIELDFLKEINRKTKALGIRLLVENHPYQDRLFKSHSEHIKKIIGERLADFCIDLPHAFVRHKRFGDEEPSKLIEKFKESIFEVHLADNNGETENPIELGQGKIAWQELVRAIKIEREEVLTVIELHGDPRPSIGQLRSLIDHM